MNTSKKLIFFMMAGSQLVACGGGGGGGGGDKSSVSEPTISFAEVAQANDHYAQVSESAYQGNSQQATLDEQNLLAFSSFLFGSDADEQPTGPVLASSSSNMNTYSSLSRIASSTLNAANAVEEKRLMKPSRVGLEEEGSSAVESSAVEISALESPIVNRSSVDTVAVDETEACESGSIRFNGTLTEYGDGVLNVTYNNCLDEGTMLSGRGHIAYNSAYPDEYILYYDHVLVDTSEGATYLDGSVLNYSNGYRFVTVSNLTISDTESSDQIRFENYAREVVPSNSEFDFSGSIYISQLGYVTVNTLERVTASDDEISEGRVTFTTDASQGEIAFYSEDSIVVALDADKDGTFERGVMLDDTADLDVNNLGELQYIAYEDLNFPPTVGHPRIYFEDHWRQDTRFPIFADARSLSDPDNDTVTVIEYRWFINGEMVLTTQTNEFPAHTAFFGDTVGVRVLVTDGQYQVLSEMATLTQRDAPAEIEISDVPSSLASGETLTFTAAVIDPDTPNQPVSAVLEGAPEGMTIDDEGLVTWTATEPEFGGVSLYSLRVSSPSVSNSSHVIRFRVDGSQANGVVARSQLSLGTDTNIIADFDNDSIKEVLTTDTNNKVMLLTLEEDTFKQDWLYPYSLPTKGRIKQVLAYDVDDDNVQEILVGTEYGVSVIHADTSKADALVVLENESLISFAVGKLTTSSNLSVQVLLSNSSGVKLVDVKDLVSGISNRLPVGRDASSVVIGNVDEDAAIEIVTNDGYIYDGLSLRNQWFYTEGFGSNVYLGDLDADSVEEIIGLDRYGSDSLKVLNARTKEVIVTNDFGRYSIDSITIGNIDADAQKELIVANSSWQGGLGAYDVSSGSFVEEAGWGISSSGQAYDVTIGNIDNDEDLEVIYRNSSRLSVIDNSVTTVYSANNLGSSVFSLGWGNLEGENVALYMSSSNTVESLHFDTGWVQEKSFDINVDRLYTAHLFDYNSDGTDELFLGVDSNYRQPSVFVLDIEDESTIWSGPNSSNWSDSKNLKLIQANNDDIYDVIYIEGTTISVVDIENEVLINSNISITEFIFDLEVSDFNADGLDDYVVTTIYKTQIWTQTTEGFELFAESDIRCKHLELINVDDDLAAEIACGARTPNDVLKILDEDLSELNSFDLNYEILEMVKDPFDSSALYIARVSVDNSYYNQLTYLSKVSAISGDILWNGFDIIGRMNKDSWHIRSAEEANGGARMSIGTDKAMYLIQ